MKYICIILLTFSVGVYVGYHSHPKLTLFCPKGYVVDMSEADAPMGFDGSDGWVEFQKYDNGNLFRSWFTKPKQEFRTGCRAFLYE